MLKFLDEPRAPHGGAVGYDGQFRRGGEFEPFYVPRARMPQIDEPNLPCLMTWAKIHGIEVKAEVIDPAELIRPHQRVNHDLAFHMSEEELAKPLLVSREPFILDGNHRHARLCYLHRPARVLMFNLEFDAAIAFLFTFPKTYSYGDGQFHPVRS